MEYFRLCRLEVITMHTIMMGILWLAAIGLALWALEIILQVVFWLLALIGVAIWSIIRALGRFFGG